MIRITVALFVFALVLCGLIVLKPFAADETVAQDRLGNPITQDVEVTRAAPLGTDALALAAAAAVATPISSSQPQSATAPRPVDVARPNMADTQLADMTNNVLAELGFTEVEPVERPNQEQFQSTSNILAGIQAATGETSVLEQPETLESIVIAALRAGESDDRIDEIVNAAAASGSVAIPDVLVTAEGRVDTHVMLNNIVTQAQIAAGGAAPSVPNVSPSNTPGMEVRTGASGEERIYTVQSGDSLGAISVKFYGVISYYDDIFEANQTVLSSPDRIRAGQRLVIPQI